MKRIFFIAVITSIVILSCVDAEEQSNKNKMIDNISLLENKYFSSDKFSANKNEIDSMINAYSNFIEKFKDDSLTVYYMFKQANLYSATQDYKNAVAVFYEITTNYNDFEKRPEALFYQAMIYGDYLKNEIMAEQIYKEFIKDYPNHDLADDAEKSIEFLGKTDQEILEILTKKDSIQ